VGSCVVEPPAQTEDPRGAEDDLTLVHATKGGHASAFEKLVRRYDRRLLRIAQSVTHNREEAEDAVQEAFFKAYQRLDQFQESAKFSTWLIRIVLNEALTKLRRQRTAREESLDRDFQSDTDIPPMEDNPRLRIERIRVMHSEIANSGITSPTGSITSPAVRAHMQPGHARPLRSSMLELQTLLRSRTCGLSDLQLLRSYFTITRLVRPMSMLSKFVLQRSESLDQLGFASAEQKFGNDPWEIRSRR
jgi:RNA polymerase sigma factor (sigma-70 family)